MAKLINVIKDPMIQLEKRQLPLTIDEKLTMVLDLIDVDFMCEYPKIRGKDKELFLKKFSMLNADELKEAFQVSCKRLLDIVSEIVPCVGCRRSVERLFHQMETGPGRSALYPLIVTPEGTLVLPDEVFKWPNVIGAMFHNHMTKLSSLSTSWSRSKKSSRCALHSLDAQRYVRPPLGSGWRSLWDMMVPFCKQEVATIDTSQLLSTLETYLQKHRFCTECRTKVMKAYSLLVDEPEERKISNNSESSSVSTSCDRSNTSPINSNENTTNGTAAREKGFVPSLYAGIRRCSPNNHIHVDQRTDYIMGLILAAEPELLGNRRERHAKTLEIAQEEVLVCVGLCLYERVHRIQLKLREEQTTCQLLALVAINALSTNFQLAVEMKQGISQLELLFQEFSREDRLKQKRKQVRRLKKRRKKERKNAAAVSGSQPDDDEEEKIEISEDDEKDETNVEEITDYFTQDEKQLEVKEENDCSLKPFFRTNSNRIMKMTRNDISAPKYLEKKDSCYCSQYEGSNKKKDKRTSSPLLNESKSRIIEKNKKMTVYCDSRDRSMRTKNGGNQGRPSKSDICRPEQSYSDTISYSSGNSNNSSSSLSTYSKYHNEKDICYSNNNIGNVITDSTQDSLAPCDCCNSIQIDCGYSSADNNISSSCNGSDDSSVDSSEIACSEGFCNHEGLEECNIDTRQVARNEIGKIAKKDNNICNLDRSSIILLNSASQSLQQMLTETAVEKERNTDQRVSEYIIPVEEIQRYKSSMGRINEKRKQLRQTLKSRFAQLCSRQQPDTLSTS